MLFTGGDAQEPMAMAEVFVRKTALLRTEKKSNAARSEMLAQWTGGLIEPAHRVLQLALADGGGPNNKNAIFNGFGHGLELLGTGKQRRCADGGTRFAKSQFIGIDYAKMEEPEVAHGAVGGTHVERSALSDSSDAQTIRFGRG